MLLITDARQEDRKEKKGNSRSKWAAAAAEATYGSESKDNSNKCACGGGDGGQGLSQVCGLRLPLNSWIRITLPQNNVISMQVHDRR